MIRLVPVLATFLLTVLASPQAEARKRRGRKKELLLQALQQGRCPELPRRKRRYRAHAKALFKLSLEVAAQADLGKGRFDRAKLELAMLALECSYKAKPHPNSYYNYAKIAERLGKFEQAIKGYQSYLALAPNAPDAGEVEEKIDVLKKALEERRRKEEEARRAEEIRRKAEELARQKLEAERLARLKAEQARKLAEKKRLAELKARQERLRAERERLRAEREAMRARLERERARRKLAAKRRRFTTTAWILGGAGVAALAAAAAFGGVALADKRTVENAPQDSEWEGDIADAYDRNKTMTLAAYITAGAGALLVGTAALLYGLSRKVRLETQNPKRPKTALVAGPGQVGLGLSITF